MKEDNFRSLKDLMEIELSKINVPQKFHSLETFITDGKECAAFIRTLLQDDSYTIPTKSDSLYEIAEMRARHSAVTFLMGLAFRKFGGLFDEIPSIINHNKEDALRMWLITSLYHDRAYSSVYIKSENLDYKKIFHPYLFDDVPDEDDLQALKYFSVRFPDTLAYTYEDIINYDKYAITYHRAENSIEKRDHGILGGVMMFSELTQKALKYRSLEELPVIKACSIAIAQHNIYKSQGEDQDKEYKNGNLYQLMSTSSFRIEASKVLLLFLSLIDTVECVKKFSKRQNMNSYLETLTVLNSIKVSVSEKEIELDYSELFNRISNKNNDELMREFYKYKNDLMTIDRWTSLCAETALDNDNKITIRLSKSSKICNKLENNYEISVAYA